MTAGQWVLFEKRAPSVFEKNIRRKFIRYILRGLLFQRPFFCGIEHSISDQKDGRIM